MMRNHYAEFWIEKRGRMWYGFCDDGCQSVIRGNYWQGVAAMEAHRATAHGGQMLLDLLTDQPPPAEPGSPAPF